MKVELKYVPVSLVDYNKGHRWSDYMSESAMSCASKGWENLKKKGNDQITLQD